MRGRSQRVEITVVRDRKRGERRCLFSLVFLLFISSRPSLLVRPPPPTTGARYGNTELYKVPLKTPGGFLFNGARRGSAPAVWFINGTLTAAPPSPILPLPLLPAPATDQRDGLDGRRGLFVAQTILSSGDDITRTFSYFLSPILPLHTDRDIIHGILHQGSGLLAPNPR